MKRSMWVRLIAVILIISMLAVPVSAAAVDGTSSQPGGLVGVIIDLIRDIVLGIFGNWFEIPGVPTVSTTPPATAEPVAPTEPGAAEPVEPDSAQPVEQTPEYELNQTPGTEAETESVQPEKTPVTMGNVSMGLTALGTVSGVQTMATGDVTVATTPIAVEYDANGNATIPSGDYVVYSSGNTKYLTNNVSNSDWNTDACEATVNVANATVWTFTRQDDGTYTIQDPDGMYLDISGQNTAGLSITAVYVRIFNKDGAPGIEKLNAQNNYDCLNALGGTGYSYFGGWSDPSPVSFYAVTTTVEPEEPDPETPDRTGTQVVYFPVTMYDYTQDTINNATDALDDDLTVREGFYFSGGAPEYTKSTTADMSAFVEGDYYIKNIRASENRTDGAHWLQAHSDNKIYANTKENASIWHLSIENGSYYLTTEIEGVTYYMIVGTNGDTDGYTTTKTAVELVGFSGNANGVQIKQGNYYLCQWGGVAVQDFGGYGTNNDPGNGMMFYPVDSETPVVPGATETKITSGYEEWNRWDKASGNNANGDLLYTGLVQDQLVNDQIVFNVPEGGVFNNDGDVKDIYEFVGLPFVLDLETGIYSFDSDENGVYFEGAPQSGTGPADDQMNKLVINQGQPQPMPTDLSVGDGSSNAFFPFNNQSSYTTSQVNYHFGMRADLPFAMTPNGRVKATDDESTPITFTFSGDDDVWVFIDGHLVIDLGGIHNRLDATIDFAANTITYYESNNQDDNNTTGSYNDSSFATTQQLFTDKDGEGVIPMTRDAFALDGDHEMQVFYLERGEGTSNGRIEFNLPMSDTVIVSKNATQSWSQAAEDEDLKDPNVDPDVAGIEPLTTTEQAIVNNIDFGFTLYKKTAEEGAQFVPVANTNFYLIGRGVEGTVINSTDANGHFYLKNGQSAKFITELPTEGVTYYVVEDQVPDGFIAPDFKYDGTAAYNYTYTGTTTSDENSAMSSTVSGSTTNKSAAEIPEQVIPMPEKDENGNWVNWKVNKSYEVTVKGSIEVQDSIEFQCVNFLDAELPNPTALTYEDIIVIDYGLPVQIDPLANDVFRGDDIEIIAFGGANMQLGENNDTNNDGIYEENEQKITYDNNNFHSGTVTLNNDTFTYTLNKQLTEVEVITYIIKVTGQEEHPSTHVMRTQYDYAIGKIYIVPATVMYYEENFSDLVTFTGSGWNKEVTVSDSEDVSAYQEPGVVGTTTDSIYGSDVAYLNDNGDSNGTYRFGDTTNGAIRFTYTFTGTGTSIFARTSALTGYMQVKIYEGTDIYDENGKLTDDYMDVYYRDTYWEDKNGSELDGDTLYNIPVYTNEDLPYGTYTMVCTVAKKGTQGAGKTQPLKKTIEHDCYDENGKPIHVEANDPNHDICRDQKGRELEAQQSGGEFYLDGIRIIQPLNQDSTDTLVEKALGAYAADGESNLDTVTLRYKLITDDETGDNEWNFAVLTDTNGSVVTAEDYKTIGPKEEVYLLPGQSVSFAVKYWHPDGYRMHMGMKAPFGTATVQVGQNTIDLNNAADCYYDISGMHASVVTKTDEDGQEYYVATYTFTAVKSIVSLTNIKVVGNYEFTLIQNTDITQ